MQKQEFIQDQTKEGLQWNVTDQNDGSVVDVSGALELTFRCFSIDGTSLLFDGTKTGGEVVFLTDGTDGIVQWFPAAGDLDTLGNFLGELDIKFGDARDGRLHDLMIIIKKRAPVS